MAEKLQTDGAERPADPSVNRSSSAEGTDGRDRSVKDIDSLITQYLSDDDRRIVPVRSGGYAASRQAQLDSARRVATPAPLRAPSSSRDPRGRLPDVGVASQDPNPDGTTIPDLRPRLAKVRLPAIRDTSVLKDPRLVLLREPESVPAAGFRVLRDSLLSQGLPHVIAVTSSKRGEGKTTLAVNLGLALTEVMDISVLLVEGHYQSPQLAEIFELRDRRSTSSDDEDVDPPAAGYGIARITEHLDVAYLRAAAGARPPSFDARSFATAMEIFRRCSYDFILIDAPPVLGAAIANLISEQCDSAIMAVRAGLSTSNALRRAADQLGRQRIFGVTLLDG